VPFTLHQGAGRREEANAIVLRSSKKFHMPEEKENKESTWGFLSKQEHKTKRRYTEIPVHL